MRGTGLGIHQSFKELNFLIKMGATKRKQQSYVNYASRFSVSPEGVANAHSKSQS